jgi:hypothetical protein
METCQWCSAPRELVNYLLFECRNWRKERKRLLQFLRETQVGLASNEAGAKAERERRESEWGIEDLDQEDSE